MNAVNGSPGLNLSRSTTDARPDNFIQTVLTGVQRQRAPARVYMPPFADVLTDAQVATVAAYVRADIAGRPAWPDLDKTIQKIRKDQQP
jgi:mono/diheme cytochrome c family protein